MDKEGLQCGNCGKEEGIRGDKWYWEKYNAK